MLPIVSPEFRLTLSILAGFALLGLMLALSGTYGVISYLASSRTREFAIRVALGAGRAGMIGLLLVQGLVLTALGSPSAQVDPCWPPRCSRPDRSACVRRTPPSSCPWPA